MHSSMCPTVHGLFFFFLLFFFFFLRLGLGQRRAVVIIGRWLLPSLVDTGHICCHYWQHILVVNWTLRNKLQWNLNRNSNIFIQENAFESVVCETAAILSRPQCVKMPVVLWNDQPGPSRSNFTWKSKFTLFLICLHHNSSPIPPRTTKFGPDVENTLVKISVVLGWLTLTFKVKFKLKNRNFRFHHHMKHINTT